MSQLTKRAGPPAAVQTQGAATWTGLFQKLETLERGISDTFHEAAAAVTRTARSSNAAVRTTSDAVHGAVDDAADAVGGFLDVAAHFRRHAWLMLGGAVLLGAVLGSVTARRRR